MFLIVGVCSPVWCFLTAGVKSHRCRNIYLDFNTKNYKIYKKSENEISKLNLSKPSTFSLIISREMIHFILFLATNKNETQCFKLWFLCWSLLSCLDQNYDGVRLMVLTDPLTLIQTSSSFHESRRSSPVVLSVTLRGISSTAHGRFAVYSQKNFPIRSVSCSSTVCELKGPGPLISPGPLHGEPVNRTAAAARVRSEGGRCLVWAAPFRQFLGQSHRIVSFRTLQFPLQPDGRRLCGLFIKLYI